MMSAWGLGNKLTIVAAILLLPQLAWAESFKLGSISYSSVVETRKFWPLATYLARQLRSEGFDQGKVVVADNLSTMSSFLQSQRVDLYVDSFFPSLAVSRLSGSKVFLRRWKLAKSDYRSIIFTRKDSGIARLEDLKGKLIAFESPFSSSSYFFPKVALLEKGLRLTLKSREIDPVKSDEVGYVFTQTDSKTILMVLNKIAAAGATDDEKYQTSAKNLDSFKIIHETESFPRHIVSHRADLPTKLVTRVKEVLLHMHQTDEGKQVLLDFENTARFEEIPARDRDLMAGIRKYVDAELKPQP